MQKISIQCSYVESLFEAIELAFSFLEQLGEKMCSLDVSDIKAATRAQRDLTMSLLEKTSRDELMDLPLLDNEAKGIAMKILTQCFFMSFFAYQSLIPLISIRMVGTTLNYGFCQHTPQAFACLALVLSCFPSEEADEDRILERLASSQNYSKIALALLNELGDQRDLVLPRVYCTVYNNSAYYREPLQSCVDALCRGHEVAESIGDNVWAV